MPDFAFAAALAASALAATSALPQSVPVAPPVTAGGAGVMRADANGDGIVTRDEATTQADAQFDAADTNRDGKVTGDEMRAAFQARGGSNGRGMGGRFGDGAGSDIAIDRDNYRARALARFDRNDANHDGKVDQAEVAAARQQRMERRGDAAAATPQQ